MASTTELGGAVYTAAVGAMHLGQYRSRSSGGGQSVECHWHPSPPGRVPRVLGPAYLDGTNLACSLKPNSFLYHYKFGDLETRPSGKRRGPGPTTSREV